MGTLTRGVGPGGFVALVIAAAPWFVGAPLHAQGLVKVGFIHEDSGYMAQLGLDMRDGFLLYWSEAGGRAGGRGVDVLVETIGSNKPDEGLTKARKLVERDRAQILGGIIATPVAYALRTYVIAKKTPLVIMTAGADGLTQKQRSKYIFRASFSNSHTSHPLGEWAYQQGYRKMILMAMDFTPGHEHIGGVARTFIEAGGQVIQEIYSPPGTLDFAPYLSQVRRDADVVAAFFGGTDALRFVVQYAEYGLKGKIPVIGKQGLTDEVILPRQGDAAADIITSGHWTPVLETPANRRFMGAYESKYRRPATTFAEQGYVGAQMIAQALEAVKGNIEDQGAFLEALGKVDVDAPRGKVKLDAFQNPIHTVYVMRVEKKGGVLQNVPIASYPNTTQFWKWTPDTYMAMPAYPDMKGKWAK